MVAHRFQVKWHDRGVCMWEHVYRWLAYLVTFSDIWICKQNVLNAHTKLMNYRKTLVRCAVFRCVYLISCYLPFVKADSVRSRRRYMDGYPSRGPPLRRTGRDHVTGATCHTARVGLTVSAPGCMPKYVVRRGCYGRCRSRSIPQWDYGLQVVQMVEYCECCEPLRITFDHIRLRCPGRAPRTHRLARAVSCRCRPCSDADPTPESPLTWNNRRPMGR